MSKKEFLNGDRIGKITVVDIGDYKNLLCKCDCGAIVKKTNEALRTAKSRGSDFYSCGCSMYQYKDGSKNYQWKGFGKISAKRWHAYKNSAKIRNIEFLISIKEAWNQLEKQNFKCALTGVTIGFGKNDKDVKNNTASLDRINSNVGYTLNNIQWVHKVVNINLKKNLDEDELKKWCKLITQNKGNNYEAVKS